MTRSKLSAMAGLVGAALASPVTAQDLIGTCGELPDKLAACEQYECEFTHPFTGESMTRTIKGVNAGKCLYRETMPNDGDMNCAYDEAGREKMAEFYRTYFEGGAEPTDNPLNDALADGTCKVTGY